MKRLTGIYWKILLFRFFCTEKECQFNNAPNSLAEINKYITGLLIKGLELLLVTGMIALQQFKQLLYDIPSAVRPPFKQPH